MQARRCIWLLADITSNSVQWLYGSYCRDGKNLGNGVYVGYGSSIDPNERETLVIYHDSPLSPTSSFQHRHRWQRWWQRGWKRLWARSRHGLCGGVKAGTRGVGRTVSIGREGIGWCWPGAGVAA